MKKQEKTFPFKVQSLLSNHCQGAETFEDAKLFAKWNFPKGYKILDSFGNVLETKKCPCDKC